MRGKQGLFVFRLHIFRLNPSDFAVKTEYKRNCEIKPGMVFPEDMHRIAVGVEYNGAAFNGFQKQNSSASTVQARLEYALSRVANEPVTLICAGRTDAGVHATGQVIHFDTLARRPLKAWLEGVNTHLPDDIRVKWSREVSYRFHARFSALSRTYRYLILSAPVRTAIMQKQVSWTSYPLDLERMRQAAELLLGEHDFTSFRAAQCQAVSPVREVTVLRLFRHGELTVLEITANAFLHHMVRNIAGVLMDIGRGVKPVSWVAELLDAKNRNLAAATGHPFGLYLVAVGYPDEFKLPQIEPGPLFLNLGGGG